jgi:mono/diheme cytochrome c family protein
MKRIAITLVILALPVAVAIAADAGAGKAVYNTKCKMCHGVDGAGAKMAPTPIAGMDAAMVKDVVTKGKGKMKPASSVTGDAVDNVAAYVASLKK